MAAQKTLIFTATYNERTNIDLLLGRIFALDPEFEVLVVDDNSPDGTGRHLDEMAAANPRLHVVHRPGKLGLGTAHQLAMVHAVQHDYDRLVTMDADLSHDPAEIPALLAALEDSDFVIGSRYAAGGSSDYEGYRKFLSVCANTLAYTLLRVPVHEFTTSFRAFRVAMLRSRRCAKLKAQGYSYFMETVFRLHRAGFRMREVPIQFRDRHSGVSKIPKWEIINGVAKLLRLTASSWFGSKEFVAAPEVEGRCYACGSTYLNQVHAPSESRASTEADTFRCSSMGHSSTPRVVLCLQCGLMQVPAADQPPQLADLYADVEDPLYLANRAAREVNFAFTFDRIAPHLPKSGALLDVGAYCGLFVAEAKRRGWDAEGVDPSRWASRMAAEQVGVTVHQGTLDSAATALKPPYDVVTTWDVLEHVADPLGYLAQINRLLKDGGVVALSTLDAGSDFARLLGRRWPWLMDMHIFYFTRPLLRRWLEQSGFEVLMLEDYRHYATVPYLWEKAAALLPGVLGRAAAGFGRLFPKSWVIPVSFGDVVLVVARKRVAGLS
ncbi:methyltransferase domain-containing protein [Magnetospirillum sp. UT-4]|uniref:methyltransferase domain-containing protein n=1 Tax=Magnetospirillum sp. UT-4 TaxID=2681467 RepID=UPI00138400F6|nr:methyltransferase domain-containing protein [Magnetospirillum sp. UT-4]CAA7621665.1 Glycosyl transferase, family 2 (modular protein) [Magnetospirillum sp. UT-4]